MSEKLSQFLCQICYSFLDLDYWVRFAGGRVSKRLSLDLPRFAYPFVALPPPQTAQHDIILLKPGRIGKVDDQTPDGVLKVL